MGWNQPITHPMTEPNTQKNIFFPTPGLSAAVKVHDKRAVGIFGNRLSEVLEKLYNIGVRKVDLVVDVGGRQIVITASIYKKVDRRSGRTYYWGYPIGSDQIFLREKYKAFRGEAERYAKTPMPIVVYMIMPKT